MSWEVWTVATEADDLDRAADLTRQQNEAAIEEVRRAARPEQAQLADGSWPFPDCEDCDEPIPAARLAMGRIRCVTCQSIRETERAQRR